MLYPDLAYFRSLQESTYSHTSICYTHIGTGAVRRLYNNAFENILDTTPTLLYGKSKKSSGTIEHTEMELNTSFKV